MNKRLVKYFWALPLLGVLSSCSESSLDEGSQNANNAVQFNVSTSKQSRAFIVDNDEVNNHDFGLFAYSHSGTWADFRAGTSGIGTPNFMNDQLVSHATGSWAYDPLKFWTNDNISFFGYWPIMDDVTKQPDAQGVQQSTASAANNAMPQVVFTQKMDAADMVDFIVSHATDKKRDDGVVTLDFKHVMTRLNFKARLDEALYVDPSTSTASTHVFLKKLSICGTDGSYDPNASDGHGGTGAKVANVDSKFYKTATFVLGDGSGTGAEVNGKWGYTAAAQQPTELDLASILKTGTQTLTSTSDPSKSYTATAIDLNNDGSPTDLLKQTADATPKQHYVFLIPPHGKDGIQSEKDVIMDLEYDIVTLDEKLGKKMVITPMHYAVSLPNGTLQQGVPYNIIFTVGMNPVKVDVNVSDWDQNETILASSETATTSDANGIVDAWRKLNTTKAQDKTGNYFVIYVNDTPSSDLDLRSAPLVGTQAATWFSAFEMGDQVELKFTKEDTDPFTHNVLVPNGWVYNDRIVNGETRHIITKTSKYATVVASNYDASTSYQTTDFESALDALNSAYATDTHNYAIDFYGAAPAAALFDMSSVDIDAKLTNFANKFDQNYLYLVFNTENASGAQTYTAPDGWTITPVRNHPGKYLLKKAGSTNGATSNISIGDQGFSIAADGTINVN